jgi:hypothetical protein
VWGKKVATVEWDVRVHVVFFSWRIHPNLARSRVTSNCRRLLLPNVGSEGLGGAANHHLQWFYLELCVASVVVNVFRVCYNVNRLVLKRYA